MKQTALNVLSNRLLDAYQGGTSFFMASSSRTLLTEGVAAELSKQEQGGLQTLPARAASLLAEAQRNGHSSPVLVGAIPFDPMKQAHLIVPEKVQWSGPLEFENAGVGELAGTSAAAYTINSVPTPEAFAQGVEQGIARLRSGELSKIVLSRALELTSQQPVDLQQLLRNLARSNTRGYTFAADLPKQNSAGATGAKERRTLVGASPELLVRRTGRQVISNPLAGSRPRSKDPIEDQRIAAELLISEKDLHEHAVVIEAVAAALRPFCKTLDVPSRPSLVHTETMWHLSTEVAGELADPSTSSLELAAALHPTPAVCGTPTDSAREAIYEIEPFDREFYTGMVGWNDASGDGEWVVTIRCAEVYDRSLRLYAGAGVVLGSSPEGELAETSAKFRTMLRAMGLQQE
ncbi:isochorismate synthase [Paenibacillus phyllosphaerae]|uniref:isochorismate synthase n=1 Tax=Paenibacillus phyllosphaerae TaxID=274593 RepID=A0A7W5FKZ2_9BACL|nr:isochorismate synthase DhbC [Paenibacillus phyllosphaerae]MBB3108626.1 isochorismate synthase [Paenibacillus phyllosphaerae]